MVAALVVALWPRSHQELSGASSSQPGGDGRLAVAVDDTKLAAARAAAVLRPCPVPVAASVAPGGPLAGVVVDCLGAPGRLDLGASLGGQATLVNVWASWCGPCRTEIPVLQAYADSHAALPVVGLDVRDDPADALALLAELGATYPAVVDVDSAAEAALAGPSVLPLSFLVDADGTVHRVREPAVFTSGDDIRSAVTKLRH